MICLLDAALATKDALRSALGVARSPHHASTKPTAVKWGFKVLLLPVELTAKTAAASLHLATDAVSHIPGADLIPGVPGKTKDAKVHGSAKDIANALAAEEEEETSSVRITKKNQRPYRKRPANRFCERSVSPSSSMAPYFRQWRSCSDTPSTIST